MVLVITGFAHLLLDFGFGEALIQDQNISDEDYSSVFWLNLSIASLLTLIVFLSAPLIAQFYKNPELISITRGLSFVFLLNGAAIVQRIKLEKSFRFKTIGLVEVVSSLLSVSLALVMAFNNYGVWSLVVLHLTKPLFYNVAIWVLSKWSPLFSFQLNSIKKLSKFSFALFINGLLGTLSLNLDKILIGRSLGETSLGVYSKSFSTVRMPVNQVMSALGRVIFPAFSSIQSDHNKIFEVYKQVVLLISTLIFPVMLTFFIFSDELVLGLFGEKWAAMGPIFKILSVTVGLIPFNILADSVVKSQGRIDLLNYITFIEKPMVIIAVVIGILMGSINTVALAFSINIVLVFFIKSFIVTKALHKTYWPLLFCHLRSIRIIILPVLAMVLIGQLISGPSLMLKFAVLASTLLVSLVLLKSSLITPAFEFIKSYRNSKTK